MLTVGVDSYVSLAEADAYFEAHDSPNEWLGQTASQKETALRYATRYIDASYEFVGQLESFDQKLKWPRFSVYDSEGRLYEGIPDELKEATCELARSHIATSPLDQVVVAQAPGIAEVTAGPVTVRFGDINAPSTNYDLINRLLAKFISSSSRQPMIVRS